MAFTTIPGTGGAPDSFVGSAGVDAITFVGSTTNFFLGAQEENDSIIFAFANILSPSVISNGTLRGGDGDDTFFTDFFGEDILGEDIATFNNVLLNGNAGNDGIELNGLFAGSTVFGGEGSDEILMDGVFLNSRVNGNKGDDSIDIIGEIVRSSIFGGQGADEITVGVTSSGTDGSDSIIRGDDGDDKINVTGAFSNTTINGNAGDDTIIVSITGGKGVDILGGAGDDKIDASRSVSDLELFGNNGNDTIIGGVGADTITGGTGADTLTGGGGDGVNTFVFATGDSLAATSKFKGQVVFAAGVDFITDFKADEDNYLVNGVKFVSADFGTKVGTAKINDKGNYKIVSLGTNTTTFGIVGEFTSNTNSFTDTGKGSYLFFQVASSASVGDEFNSLTTEAIISDLIEA